MSPVAILASRRTGTRSLVRFRRARDMSSSNKAGATGKVDTGNNAVDGVWCPDRHVASSHIGAKSSLDSGVLAIWLEQSGQRTWQSGCWMTLLLTAFCDVANAWCRDLDKSLRGSRVLRAERVNRVGVSFLDARRAIRACRAAPGFENCGCRTCVCTRRDVHEYLE